MARATSKPFQALAPAVTSVLVRAKRDASIACSASGETSTTVALALAPPPRAGGDPLHFRARGGRRVPVGPGNSRWRQGVVDGNLVVAATPRGAVYNSTGG